MAYVLIGVEPSTKFLSRTNWYLARPSECDRAYTRASFPLALEF
ncbi:MAG: hypothetical protein AB1589_43965 [Cyanobacteriota bacterium]